MILANRNNIYIEKNLKEQLPPDDEVIVLNKDKVIIGYDAHCIDDIICNMRKFFEIQNKL